MKILHINSYFKGSKFYKNLYNKQVESGLNIDVYVPVSSNDELEEEFGDYTTVSVSFNKYDRLFFYLKHNKILKDIDQKFKINEYSLIHAHSLFSNGYVAMKLSKKYKIPYIVAVRDTDVNLFFKKMPHLRKLGVDILNNAKYVVFLSKGYRETVLKKYVPDYTREKIFKNTFIIPNGIDDYWFNNIGVTKNTPSKSDLKLLYVGVINKRKNITTTIKAIDLLIERGYNINFTVVGKVSDQKIFRKIKSLPYVNYISSQPKEKLINIYRSHDIFVMPSITETFGLVYPEAMSQGLPVIYSRGQGFDRQFKDGLVGFSVESNNYNEIVIRIINIIENYDAISERNLNLVEKFKWDNIVKQYEQIYNSSINCFMN